MLPDATLLAPGPAPGGSSELSEGAGLALVPGIRTFTSPRCLASSSDPHFEAISFDLQKGRPILRLFLPQDPRVLQTQSPQLCALCPAQLQGALRTFEVTVNI